MKTSALVSLLQATKGVMTVKVKFSNGGTAYTYKTLIEHNPGDFVVVEAREAYSIAKVIEMDEVPDINPEADFDLKWVIQSVDLSRIEQIRLEEKRLARQISLTEARKRIKNVIDDLGIDVSEIDMPALIGKSTVVE